MGNYLTCGMDLFWSKHQNSADWREDYVRDQQKVKVVNSVFEKFQKIDETKLKNAHENTKSRIFDEQPEMNRTQKRNLSHNEETISSDKIPIHTQFMRKSLNKLDEKNSRQKLKDISLNSGKKIMAYQNSPELKQLKQKLDSKLISAEQSMQIIEKKALESNLKHENIQEKSIAELMKSKNGLAEDFINGSSEQEDKKKRENEKYLNFLRSQIDAKCASAKAVKIQQLKERQKCEELARQNSDEHLQMVKRKIRNREEFVEGLEAGIKAKYDAKSKQPENEEGNLTTTDSYENILLRRQAEAKEKRANLQKNRAENCEKVYEKISEQNAEKVAREKILHSYDSLAEEKRLIQKEQHTAQVNQKKLENWRKEVQKQLEIRKNQLKKEQIESAKIRNQIIDLESRDRAKTEKEYDEKRMKNLAYKSELEEQIKLKKEELERQKAIECELDAEIVKYESNLAGNIEKEEKILIDEFNARISSIQNRK